MIPIIIPKTRKGAINFLTVLLVIFIIAAVVSFVVFLSDQQRLEEKGQPSFNTLPIEELEHKLYVTGTIDLAIDYYAEEYVENYGVRTSQDSESLYYLIPIYDEDNNGYLTFKYFITFESDPDDFDVMERILEQTWSDVPEMTSLEIENGSITNLPDDLKQYLCEWMDTAFYEGGTFIDWCAEMNILGTDDRSEIRSKVVPYQINKLKTLGTDISVPIMFLGFAVLMLIVILIAKRSDKPDRSFETLRYMDDNL